MTLKKKGAMSIEGIVMVWIGIFVLIIAVFAANYFITQYNFNKQLATFVANSTTTEILVIDADTYNSNRGSINKAIESIESNDGWIQYDNTWTVIITQWTWALAWKYILFK